MFSIKQIAAQVHGSVFVIFAFLENDDIIWKYVEPLEFVYK